MAVITVPEKCIHWQSVSPSTRPKEVHHVYHNDQSRLLQQR